jgi:hypothetical protein
MKKRLIVSTMLLGQVLNQAALADGPQFSANVIAAGNRVALAKRYVTIEPNKPVPSRVTYFLRGGKPYLQMKRNKFIRLIPKVEMEKPLTRVELQNVAIGKFFPILSSLFVNHRPKQSEVKDQGGRGTCVAHASLAGLERFYGKFKDLSEEYAYKMYETRPGENCSSEGLKTTNSASYLKNNYIPTESVWGYDPQFWSSAAYPGLTACQRNTHQDPDQNLPPAISVVKKQYGIGSFQLIGNNSNGGTNPNRKTIDNVKYLKGIIGQGYDIVAGLYVTGNLWANDGVTESTEIVTATPGVNGCTVGSTCSGGHAVLLVGYNDLDKYFIVKNSWGDGYKDDGYMKLSYDYLNDYGKYGYYIKSAVRRVKSNGKITYKKEIFKNKTSVMRKFTGVKKGKRYISPKIVVNKKGQIKLRVKRALPINMGFGKMTIMLFKEGTYNRVARLDTKKMNMTLTYNVNSGDKLGKYYYHVVKFGSSMPEKGKGTLTVPRNNL